jgi:hypothetical protein
MPGVLCISCLERRLGRELVLDDFTDVPANDWIPRALRLRVTEAFPYVWAWSQPAPWNRRAGYLDRDRKGERCRVVCRGTKNSALVEFEDGYRTVTSRNGLRRAPEEARAA